MSSDKLTAEQVAILKAAVEQAKAAYDAAALEYYGEFYRPPRNQRR